MNKFKIAIILVVCFVAVAVMAGCSGADPEMTVATVNGTAIPYRSYVELYNGLMSTYGYEDGEELKDITIEELVVQELLLQYAQENGLDAISDEEQLQIDESVVVYFDTLKSQMVEEAGAQDSGNIYMNPTSEAQKMYDDYIKENYITEESVREHYTKQVIFGKVRNEIMEGFSVTDEEVQAYYDENVAIQELAAQSDPDLAAETYLSGGYDVSLYVPESVQGKAKMIKHVLVEISDEEYMQILAAQQEADYELADQIQQEALEAVYPRAQEVIEKLNGGEDFDTLIAEYNDDPGMESNPDGYLVYEGSSFVESFVEEAMRLENVGDTSTAPVESFYGYHILQYASDPAAGPVPLDDVSDSIKTVLASQNQSVFWQNALQAMQDRADIVNYEF